MTTQPGTGKGAVWTQATSAPPASQPLSQAASLRREERGAGAACAHQCSLACAPVLGNTCRHMGFSCPRCLRPTQ